MVCVVGGGLVAPSITPSQITALLASKQASSIAGIVTGNSRALIHYLAREVAAVRAGRYVRRGRAAGNENDQGEYAHG